MNSLSPILKNGFDRDVRLLPTDRFSGNLTQYEEVLKAHYFICDYFWDDDSTSLFGIKNVNMLCSAVVRQVVEFMGIRKWNDEFEIVATLFFGLVKNHPFHDGNKRTALLVLLYHLRKINRTPKVSQRQFEELTVCVAASNWDLLFGKNNKKIFGCNAEGVDLIIRKIAQALRKMTRPIDGRFRPVTYFELEAAIAKFGFKFQNPHKNTIDVYQCRPHVNFFGLKTKKMEDVKICNIGFPGYKRQVSRDSLKEILKKIGLDGKHGFDRASIFHDAEPLYKLIQDYEGPLRRLRDN